MSEIDTSADYCYRHPGRQSWVLCQRCGRTICPECQTQAAVGVQCPDCVREGRAAMRGGGGNGPRPARVTAMRRRPAWQGWLRGVLMPGSGAPVVTWIVVAALLLVFLANLFTGSALLMLLAAFPGQPPWELWRFL